MIKGSGTQGAYLNEPLFAMPGATAAAHELKTPLALIRQLAQSIESGEYRARDVERAATQIRLTSERALRLATDLTRAERMHESLFPLEPVSVASICDDAVLELSPLYTSRDHHIEFVSPRRLPPAVANRDLLRRVIINLADNALHYSDTEQPVVVRAQHLRRRNIVRVGIRDRGPQVPTTVWRSVRSSASYPQPVSLRPESSGLGLYIAQLFARHMQAQLGVIRHRDGASFYIDVPGSSQLALL